MPASKMFGWYVQHFRTVELNNTFYRLPASESVETWRELAPPGFTFAVKASRFITHMKRLRDPERALEAFFSRVNLLGDKLGPILFQLPPNWEVNIERLEELLQILPRNHQYCFEFRDATWCIPEVYEVLRGHNAALCLHDWQMQEWPTVPTADFAYLRFHGASGRYGGSYEEPALRRWAKRIRQWEAQLKRVYVYFNNDIGCAAVGNAQTLQRLLGRDARREQVLLEQPGRRRA